MGKIKDITGQRFGRLILLERMPKYKNNRTYYKCLCDCGNIYYVETSRLIAGATKSCGCLKSELSSQRFSKDYTGYKFGKLTLIERIHKYNGGKHVFYKCKCECGNILYIKGTSIISGNTKSCGCHKKQVNRIRCFETRKVNDYKIIKDIVYIKPSNSDLEILIDIDDLNDVLNYYWRINKNGYAVAKKRDYSCIAIKLHRLISKNNTKNPTDHINRNKLDNRKSNLRICTPIVNSNNVGITKFNSTGYKNVVKNKNKFAVNFVHFGTAYWVGKYKSINEAVEARNKKYKELGIQIED